MLVLLEYVRRVLKLINPGADGKVRGRGVECFRLHDDFKNHSSVALKGLWGIWDLVCVALS